MESAPRLERRKACDTCFRKKIKCDTAKPSCSNCQLYKTPCQTTATAATRRTSAAPKRPLAQDEDVAALDASAKRTATLEDRLSRIETQLQQVIHYTVSASPTNQSHQHSQTSERTPRPNSALTSNSTSSTSLPVAGGHLFSAKSLPNPSDGEGSSGASPSTCLPPLDDILPIVERFFDHTNHLLPIFDKGDFPRLLMDWFSSSDLPGGPSSISPSAGPTQGTIDQVQRARRAIFATINVVLALAHHTLQEVSQTFDLSVENVMAEQYRRNVERVIPDLIGGVEDLVGLRVFLGMVLLHMGGKNEQPATMLIGAAVHMCNRLHLNSREENAKCSPLLQLQRERLFWVTYILDKDISLRYHTPSLLADDDVELELPLEQPADGVGVIYVETQKGVVCFNFLALRVGLATIQGEVYDQLYSNRANRANHPTQITTQQRQARVYLLHARLETWRRTIPDAFQAKYLAETLGTDELGTTALDTKKGAWMHMVELHLAYMACLVRVHGIWSHDAEWQKLLSGFGKEAVHSAGIPGGRCSSQPSPVPKYWDSCVKLSRDCLRLVQSTPWYTRNIWSTGCSYISSLVIVLANLFQCDDLQQLESDQALTRQGLFIFARMKEASSWQPLHHLHSVVRELDRRAADEVRVKANAGRRCDCRGASNER